MLLSKPHVKQDFKIAYMSKMTIVINVRIVSMLGAYAIKGRRNWHVYSVHRGFGGSFWRAVLNYKKNTHLQSTNRALFVCACLLVGVG